MDKKEYEEQMRITRLGNPGKPRGKEGETMLKRMNESHFEVTGWALGFWNIKQDDKILDIGCGGGATLKRMADKINTGHLTGVDYSEVSVATSKETNEENIKNNKMDVINASVEALPFENDTFDKIITVESFYFWPNPAENLKEVFRVLKKGGEFLLVADVYNKEGLSKETLKNIDEFNLFNPTKDEFAHLLKNAGFKNVAVNTKEELCWVCAKGSK